MTKQAYRQAYKMLVGRSIAPDLRLDLSRQIAQKLSALVGAEYRHIGCYMPMADEPDLTDLFVAWAHERHIYLPKVCSSQDIAFYPFEGLDRLVPSGQYRILEPHGEERPIAPSDLDLIIVPAVAYDQAGYRLGRGKGYYDRYLAHCRAYKVGVTLGLMPIESLPRDPWDIPMDLVLGDAPHHH